MKEDFAKLLISILSMHRAHEESEVKSRRVSQAWSNKKKRAIEGNHKLTSRCPSWLILNKSKGEYEIIPEKAEVVKRIFQLALDGHGKRSIVKILNEEKVPPFGKSPAWVDSYVQKILKNESVIGKYHLHKMEDVDGVSKRVPIGEVINDYFPPVIDPGVFYRVNDMRKANRFSSGPKGKSFSNLFTGIVKCGLCSSPMHHINKGKPPKGSTYLVCSNAISKASDCPYTSFRYDAVQSSVLASINEVDFDSLFPLKYEAQRKVIEQLEGQKALLKKEFEDVESKIDTGYDCLLEGKGTLPRMQKKLDDLERNQKSIKASIDSIDQELSLNRSTLSDNEDSLKELFKAHLESDEVELYSLRTRLHQLLKKNISSLSITPTPDSEKHKGYIDIRFTGLPEFPFRRIYLDKKQKTADSCIVSEDGKLTFHTHSDCTWPPKSRVVSGSFLKDLILGREQP
jgi:hypothetical protein